MLDVYDWPCPDGVRGGSAHVHLASSEGYIVVSGAGRLQTLGGPGYAEVPLGQGDCVWFTPGTVHRLVNDDGRLRILVIMQNGGLPEVGDCVLTFPADVLADPARYAAASALPAEGAGRLAAAARRRRDLAIEGFLELRDRVLTEGPTALERFHAAAAQLGAGRAAEWRRRWQDQAAAVTAVTGRHLDEIEAGRHGHLAAAALMRIPHPDGARGYGMCGRLTAYRPAQARIAGPAVPASDP
jgi:Cupin domain